MAKKDSDGIDRRAFLGSIGAAGAATAAAATGTAAPADAKPTTLPPVSQAQAALIGQIDQSPPSAGGDGLHIQNAGSDYMVDVMMALGYKYVAAMPGTTFRGLQESVVNYALGKMEWLSCAHEEISGSIAHGYAKASGHPMAIMVHNTVGLQHATMAIYNAWADRVPMLVMLGNYADGAIRQGGADWDHAATDDAAMCRGYIKYDEQPGSLEHYKESLMRAHGLMMTSPGGPSIIVCEEVLQEAPATRRPQPPMPAYVAPSQPIGDLNAVKAAAQMLLNARYPVIVADRSVHSQRDVQNLVALAEALQAPVIDKLGRMNFPTNHYLNGSAGMASEADVLLALDVGDLFSIVNHMEETIDRPTKRVIKPDCKVISIDSQLLAGAGNYQDKQRFYQPDLPIPGDAAATLPYLLDAVRSAMSATRRNENQQREAALRQTFYIKRMGDMQAAAVGWDMTPISTARVYMELYKQIKDGDWGMMSNASFQSNWPTRLWDFTDYKQHMGGSGAAGIGYLGGAVIGGALAHKGTGRLCFSVQGDGDFLVGPGAMWTAAHHHIPILMIIHNNRAWHQETMSVQLLASRRDRHPERGRIGTEITDPNINYAKIAQGFGVFAENQVTRPEELASAMARAIKVVRSGEPALLDIVMQPR